ncbi:class I SAM-dependent methyltransferase [Algoriphagus boritolerans]|uniref:Methyltransferase domain-containing protein n=1 Tax=Algoriphagus boritolerans DSM 17298 = JCM 18970 TaxID=1120964 RepID=A0A1H6ACE8_9BACT|nr:class I SAM-dependent methyltransferase [Algoriphagus boritolerans]SEG45980.1 Methyltransferase domain-containing protein [Algoriphagus boritolerans DSM 17298 = JCM 18970]
MIKYLHGFTSEEQQRLVDQAGFLAPLIYPTVNFAGCRKLLEIGSGVGAQTSVLLRLFPDLHITSVDFSETQLLKAKDNLREFADRVTFVLQDVEQLSLAERFDSAFICWALEHIPNPLLALQQVKKHLIPGASIHITEVFNATFYCRPLSPAMEFYYQKYNEQQVHFGGNPDVGAQLGNLLFQAGFKEIELIHNGFHLDQSNPDELKRFIEFWKILMKSGAPGLLEAGSVSQSDIDLMENDLDRILADENAVFFYQFVQAKAKA